MGCVGKGCLILACFIVFLIIAGAIGLYFGMRTHSAVLHSFYWAKKMHVLAQEPSPQLLADFLAPGYEPDRIEVIGDMAYVLVGATRYSDL